MSTRRPNKRRAEAAPEPDDESPEASPEPATQRRRISASPEQDGAYGSDRGDNARNGSDSQDQMVKRLVRLALACEYTRKPLRRSDISEKVLGSSGRQFKAVFNGAQHHLRTVFGMELVELPAREKVTVQQKRAAQKSQSQPNKAPANWVLISILPTRFRTSDILDPISAPTPAEEAKYTAIYTSIISVIMLSGGQLPDAKMERFLRRTGMEDNAPIDGYEKTEKLIKRLEKDGYVVKIKESAGNGEEDVYWIVGPRGKVEVGEKGVEGLVRAVYNVRDGKEEEGLAGRIKRSLGIEESARREANAVPARKKKGRQRRQREEDDGEGQQDDEEDDEE